MENTTSPLLLSLSCFLILFAFTTKPGFVAAAQEVVDTDGEPLRWFTNYYVLPHIWGPTGGGLSLGTHNNKSCPLYVTKEISEIESGLPVRFSPVFSKLPIVTPSADLTIQTTAITVCIESLVWRLVKESSGLWFVGTNGVKSPGTDGITSTFKIEKSDQLWGYNLVFCPRLDVPTLCKGLGTHESGYLALGDDIKPYTFVFRKAPSPRASSKYIETVA
ncbi:Kunitz trypsin inhibitor [Quillaja saponaria]|uniref:Kunitz trypsin inhibitor n=1 Tax=Quillaja saponaria TaxID=32244 RepID=A0AAD7Q5Z8_QUISA|nr:Kunitz trypsin inhibitor [Quillaja saponaria]